MGPNPLVHLQCDLNHLENKALTGRTEMKGTAEKPCTFEDLVNSSELTL